MGVIIRQSVRNTIISYGGVALGFIITIWLYPQFLTAEQYGLTRVLISMAAVCTQFASLGITNTIVRYFPYFKDERENHHGFLFFVCVVPLIGFILLGLFLLLGRNFIIAFYQEKSALLTKYYLLLIPLAFCVLFFNVLQNVVKVLQNITIPTFLNDICVRILVVIALIFYTAGWISFNQFMILFVLNYGIVLVILVGYLTVNHKISFQPNFDFLNKTLLKSIAQYSTFAFWGGLSSIAVANIDVLMLSALAGLKDTGIYAIAFYIGSAITITRRSIYAISSPLISDAFKNNDLALIENIYKRSSLNQLIGGGLVFCGILVNLPNLMHLLPPTYAGGSIVIIIIGTAKLFDMTTGLNGAIILNSDYYKFDLSSMMVLIGLSITLNFFLIPPYGILGAAIGTASSVIVYNTLKVIFVAVVFKMQPFKKSMVWVCLTGTIIVLLSYQLNEMINVYADILIRSTFVIILYIGIIVKSGISTDFNSLIHTTWIKFSTYFISQ